MLFTEMWLRPDMFDPLEEGNLSHATEVTADYINFCIDFVIPKKTMKVFQNSKPQRRFRTAFTERNLHPGITINYH